MAIPAARKFPPTQTGPRDQREDEYTLAFGDQSRYAVFVAARYTHDGSMISSHCKATYGHAQAAVVNANEGLSADF